MIRYSAKKGCGTFNNETYVSSESHFLLTFQSEIPGNSPLKARGFKIRHRCVPKGKSTRLLSMFESYTLTYSYFVIILISVKMDNLNVELKGVNFALIAASTLILSVFVSILIFLAAIDIKKAISPKKPFHVLNDQFNKGEKDM